MFRPWIALLTALVPLSAFAETAAGPGGLAVEPMSMGNVLSMISGLGVIILMIVGLAWLVKRFTHTEGFAGGPIKVIAGRSLGPRERVVVLEVGKEQILVGISQGRLVKLHELAEPLPEPDQPEMPGFARILSRARKGDEQ